MRTNKATTAQTKPKLILEAKYMPLKGWMLADYSGPKVKVTVYKTEVEIKFAVLQRKHALGLLK
jgi:hypothetical protein